MDTLGAFLGLAIAAIIIYFTIGNNLELSLKTYQWLIIVGVIPAIVSVVLLVTLVHERKTASPKEVASRQGIKLSNLLAGFDTRFKLFLAVIAVFTLGNPSNFFIILRAQDLGSPVLHVTLMLVLFNAIYAVISLPIGILSDKLGRRKIIILGWLIYALVYLGFALASSTWQIWLLFACFGVYYGITEGVARAFVADMVPQDKRGTAYGLYHGVLGIALLPASLIAGWLWQEINPATTFFYGAGLAFLATLGIIVLIKE